MASGMFQPQKILVVDDDEGVRDIAVSMLGTLGYEVLFAANGNEALSHLRKDPSIRLLFTDVVMPGMDGFELAHRAKEFRAELPVIYTSGYNNVPRWGEHGLGYGPLIPKPWPGNELLEQVAKALKG
jgi:CheY-like chemotaxis protein